MRSWGGKNEKRHELKTSFEKRNEETKKNKKKKEGKKGEEEMKEWRTVMPPWPGIESPKSLIW
jgi:hypothetical protein